MMLSANNAWRERNPRPTMNFIQKNWKGILVCLVMAVPCWLLGQRFPIVGGPVFGILAGMIVTLLWHDKSAAQPGISFVSKKVLQYAVILLGFGMNLSVIWQTGKQSLPIILVTITTSLVVAWLLHKLLHIPGKISTLVGVGSSICGLWWRSLQSSSAPTSTSTKLLPGHWPRTKPTRPVWRACCTTCARLCA